MTLDSSVKEYELSWDQSQDLMDNVCLDFRYCGQLWYFSLASKPNYNSCRNKMLMELKLRWAEGSP